MFVEKLALLWMLHKTAKSIRLQNPLQGFGGASVLEVVEDYFGDTYRAVYTVKFAEAVYVLHTFKKKSKSGIKTPKQEIDLIKSRLLRAKEDYEQWLKTKKLQKKVSKEIYVSEGSGNVFADLGLEDAEELLVKSGLSRQIYNRIKELKLTQANASSILGVSQPDISKVVNCRYTGFSIERLISLLNKLSVDVDITVRPRSKTTKTPGSFRLLEGSEIRAS